MLGLALCTWGATLIQITHMLHVCNLTLPGLLPANSTLLSFLPNASSVTCFPPFQSLRKIWSVKSVAELPLTSVMLGVKLSAYETYTFLFRKLSNITKGSFQSCSSPKCSVRVLHFFPFISITYHQHLLYYSLWFFGRDAKDWWHVYLSQHLKLSW